MQAILILCLTVLSLLQSRIVSAAGDFGPDTCLEGFVWREAVPNDHVCVPPSTRTQARQDNDQALSRREPNGGPFGPDTCKQGYVWREATPTDHVCVTPATRTQTAEDNRKGPDRRASLNIWLTHWAPGPVCNGDVCSITSDHDIGRFTVNGDHFNIGRVTVGIYRSNDNSRIWGTSLDARPRNGFVGGSFDSKSNVIDCRGATPGGNNAYARAYDHISQRWSTRIYLRTGCNIL